VNAKLILMLGALGVLEAAASLAGLLHAGAEWPVSCAIALVVAVIAGRAAPHRPFLHGLLAGALAFGIPPVLQAVFFQRYVALNPQVTGAFASLPKGISPRAVVLAGACLVSVLGGLAVGLLAWIVSKLGSRRPKTPALT
jgi:hypothetical protein